MKKRKAGKVSRAGRPKSAQALTAGDKALDAMIDANAAALTLRIEKAWRPPIRSNLDVTLKHAARVMEFTLPDEAEPAPVYRV